MTGKPRHGSASDDQIRWQSVVHGTGMRHRHDVIDGGVNSVEELDAEMFSPRLVPAASESVFGVRFRSACVLLVSGRASRRTRTAAAPVVIAMIMGNAIDAARQAAAG